MAKERRFMNPLQRLENLIESLKNKEASFAAQIDALKAKTDICRDIRNDLEREKDAMQRESTEVKT